MMGFKYLVGKHAGKDMMVYNALRWNLEVDPFVAQ
jgi:hypothetical protein